MSKSIYFIAACSLMSTLSWAEGTQNATHAGAHANYSKDGSAHQLNAQTAAQSQTLLGSGSMQAEPGSVSGSPQTNLQLMVNKPATSLVTTNSTTLKTGQAVTANQSITASKPSAANQPSTAGQPSTANQLTTANQAITASQQQSHNLVTQTPPVLDSNLAIAQGLDATQTAVSENIANSIDSNLSQAAQAATAAAINQTISNQVNSTINQEIGDAVKTSINNSVNNTVTQTLGF